MCLRNSEIGGRKEIRSPFANPVPTFRQPFAKLFCQPLSKPLFPWTPGTRLETWVYGFLEAVSKTRRIQQIIVLTTRVFGHGHAKLTLQRKPDVRQLLGKIPLFYLRHMNDCNLAVQAPLSALLRSWPLSKSGLWRPQHTDRSKTEREAKSRRFLLFPFAIPIADPRNHLRLLSRDKAMLHSKLRVRWKVASDMRFRTAISESETPSFCGISGGFKLAPSMRKTLAIAILRFWCMR